MYLFGEADGVRVKSVPQMRVQLEGGRDLHDLEKEQGFNTTTNGADRRRQIKRRFRFSTG